MNLRHESDVFCTTVSPTCRTKRLDRSIEFRSSSRFGGLHGSTREQICAGSLSSKPFVRKSGGNGLTPKLFPLRGVFQTASYGQDLAKARPRSLQRTHDLYPRRTRINFQAHKEDKKHLRSPLHDHFIRREPRGRT
jgi:hypothetical protein